MTNPNRVIVSMGYTRNMGNFESLRVDIGVETDALQDEHVNDTYKRARTFVEDKLLDAVREVEEELKDAKGA